MTTNADGQTGAVLQGIHHRLQCYPGGDPCRVQSKVLSRVMRKIGLQTPAE